MAEPWRAGKFPCMSAPCPSCCIRSGAGSWDPSHPPQGFLGETLRALGLSLCLG